MIRIHLFLFLFLFGAGNVTASSKAVSCRRLTQEVPQSFTLISRASYQNVKDIRGLEFRFMKYKEDGQSYIRSEAVADFAAPAEFVYKEALDVEAQIAAVPLVSLLSASKDRKSISVGIKIPLIGKIEQAIRIDSKKSKLKIFVFFEEGPLEGLEGEVQFFKTANDRSEIRGFFSGQISKNSPFLVVPSGIIETFAQKLLERMKDRIEAIL